MNLAAGMKKHNVTAEQIAKVAGVKVAMVKAVLKGRKLFHPKRLPPILALFKGDVTRDDLYAKDKVKMYPIKKTESKSA